MNTLKIFFLLLLSIPNGLFAQNLDSIIQQWPQASTQTQRDLDHFFDKHGFPTDLKVNEQSQATIHQIIIQSTDCQWTQKWTLRYLDAFLKKQISDQNISEIFKHFYHPTTGLCTKKNTASSKAFIQSLRKYPKEFGYLFDYADYYPSHEINPKAAFYDYGAKAGEYYQDENYAMALKYVHLAEKEAELQPSDFFFVIQCAMHLKKYSTAIKYVDKLQKANFPISYFLEYDFYKPLTKSKAWKRAYRNLKPITLSEKTINNTKHYYESTQRAETYIIDNNFAQALREYEEAMFARKPFRRDAFNAIHCAILEKDYSSALPFVEVLVARGIPLAYFEKNSEFHALTASPKWVEFKTKPHPITYNKALQAKFDSLIFVDQAFRANYELNIDTLRIIDQSLKEELNTIFDQYGFPNDDLVGITMKNDSTISNNTSNFNIILIHQIKNSPEELIPRLKNFVLSGAMKNTQFASHSRNFPHFSDLEYGNTLFIQIRDEIYAYSLEKAKQIDHNRAQIFLAPIYFAQKKVAYNKETKSPFHLAGGVMSKHSPMSDELHLKKVTELQKQGYQLYKRLDQGESISD